MKSRNLTLLAAGAVVPLGLAADSPMLMMLAVEDFCWQVAVADLGPRPPVWRRSERAEWQAARLQLDVKRERLVEMAAEAVCEL